MTDSVTLSSAMRANLLSLQNTAELMATTQQRLATGKKVNSALDNPTSYFAAQSLTSRAGDLSNLLDGMGQGIQSLTAATQGITSAESIVQQMQSVANSAMQSINASNASSTATLNTVTNSAASMTSVVTNLTSTSTPPTFAGMAGGAIAVGNNFSVAGSDGTITTITIQAGETMAQLASTVSSATNGNVSMSVNNGKFTVTNTAATGGTAYSFAAGATGIPLTSIFGALPGPLAAGGGSTTGAAPINANTVVAATASTKLYNTAVLGTFVAGTNLTNATGATASMHTSDQLVVTLGTGASATTHTIEVSADNGADGGVSTIGDLLTQLNNISGINASLDSTGKLSITATGGKSLTLTSNNTGTVANAGDFAATFGFTSGTTISATNAAPSANFGAQFDGLRSQLDQLVQDSGYQGTNLISGATNAPLKILFNANANNPNELVVNAMDLTSSGLGVNTTSGVWNSAADVTNTLSQLTTATATLRTAASQLGTNLTTVQTRQSFTTTLINTLQDGAGNLTNADMNQESANMLALQTQQQLGTSSLSLASQAAQSVLKLFP